MPVLYIFAPDGHGGVLYRTFLILKGKDGDSFCASVDQSGIFQVIHGHAIRRYMERRKFQGTLEQAQNRIMSELFINGVEKDLTDETRYIYFDGGLFLCTYDDGVMHLRTYITNRQCSPMQRMMSFRSQKQANELRRRLGVKPMD